MRVFLLLASASVLASCGGAGGGVSSLASSAVTTPVASVTPTPTATPTPIATATPTATPTPTPTPGVTGTPTTVTPPSATPTGTSMFDVTSAVSFKAIGGVHALDVTTSTDAATGATRKSTLYAGNASLPSAPTGTISYDPRDGVFELSFADTKAGVTQTDRFQDPVHRIDFAGARALDAGIVQLSTYNYLRSDSATAQSIFFYQRPGNRTNYVTLGGYVHREVNGTTSREVRGAMAFGAPTPSSQLPRTGSGSYSGEFLATMVGKNANDPTSASTTFQWVSGQSAVNVDFGAGTVGVQLAGNVTAGVDSAGAIVNDDQLMVRGGSSFNAAATAKLDLAAGTFAGKFTTATFGSMNGTPLDFAGITPGSDTAGASSVDGSFYGPNAQEVGGSFRIIGGRPDQRLDILGAFTGKK